MQNVTVKVEKNMLILTVDLTKKVGPSKSGKTTLIATSSGNQVVTPEGVTIGLNVYTKT